MSDFATLAGGFGNLFSLPFQGALNYDLMHEEQAFNERMVKEQNEYNSPKSQLQRYLDAGLNPNLIYGEGKASAGNQTSLASYHPINMDLQGAIAQAFQMSFENAMRQKEINADVKVKENQASLLDQQIKNYHQDFLSKVMDNLFKSELTGYRVGIYTDDDFDKLRKSKMYEKYSNEVQSQTLANELKSLQAETARLSNREKNWLFQNMLPIQLRVQEAIERGTSADAAIKEVQKNLEENLGRVGGSSGAVKLLIDFLRTIFR